MEAIISLAVVAVCLLLGLVVGGTTERRHFANLARREQAAQDFLVTQIKAFPGRAPSQLPPKLFVAEVVIASDYLKSFLASLRNFFGGEVRSYQSLLIRARREALLRIIEQARAEGYNAVCNLRLDTADIGGNVNTKGATMAAIIASATAYHAGNFPGGRL